MDPTSLNFDQDTIAKIQQAQQLGYSPNDIIAKASAYQAAKSQAPAKPAGGGFADLLPLIGGVGGSLLGATAGPVGAIGGGAGGSALGELLRQLFTGQKTDIGNIAKEGAIGGAGGVAGEVLGPALRFGGKVLGDTIPNVLDKTGTDFIASQYNLPRSLARTTIAADSQPLNQLAKYGITNINDVTPAAEQVTGANGILSQMTRRAVGKAAPVDTAGIGQMARDLVSVTPTTGDQKVLNFVDNMIKQMNGGSEGSIAPASHPSDVFGAIQQLEAKANEINRVPLNARSQEAVNTAKIYKQLASELKDRLFTGKNAIGELAPTGGADSVVSSNIITPEEFAQLEAIHPQLAHDAINATTVADLRKLAEPFVKGSIAAHETEAGSQLGFNNVAGAAKGLGKLVQNPLNIAAVPLGSDAVNAGVGGAFKSAASKMRGIPTPNVPDWMASLFGQGGAQAVSGGPEAGQGAGAAASIPNPASMGSMDTNPAAQQISSQDQLRKALGVVLLRRARSGSDLLDAFKLIAPNANLTPLSPDQQKLQAYGQSGLRSLGAMEQILQQDPNAPLKSKLPIIAGRSPYAAAANEVKDVYLRLRTGASLNKDEQTFYDNQLPQPFDSPDTINYKLSLFKNLFSKFAFNQQSTATSPSVPSGLPAGF